MFARGLLAVGLLAALSLSACDKEEPDDAAQAAPSATQRYGHAPLPTPPPAPRKWVHVDSKTDGGADAGSSRARLMETKDRLKALVASGKGSDLEKAMLRILCNSLGDESCSSKQDSHSEAMPGVKPDSKQK